MENQLLNGKYFNSMPILAFVIQDAVVNIYHYIIKNDSRNKIARKILDFLIKNQGKGDCHQLIKFVFPKFKRYPKRVFGKEYAMGIYMEKIKDCSYKTLGEHLKNYGLFISFNSEKIEIKKL